MSDIFRKIRVRSLVAQRRNVYFVKTSFTSLMNWSFGLVAQSGLSTPIDMCNEFIRFLYFTIEPSIAIPHKFSVSVAIKCATSYAQIAQQAILFSQFSQRKASKTHPSHLECPPHTHTHDTPLKKLCSQSFKTLLNCATSIKNRTSLSVRITLH